jgi:hypothetical protein
MMSRRRERRAAIGVGASDKSGNSRIGESLYRSRAAAMPGGGSATPTRPQTLARLFDGSVERFSLPDGNFTAYQSSLTLGTNVRELKLDKDAIGQRAYEIVATAAEGDVVLMDFSFRSRDQNCPPPSNLWKRVSAIRPAAWATLNNR